ncbi:DDT domain-containing protein [Forsythia ovata]|uniref:DDT domain-containing protein n=1 Tax=Forsythia ovata TaxID=205694 RepID=A0ABD1U8B7_9LAMI
MPLYKRKPFSLVEKPKDLKPQELVFQVRFTKEIFRDYSEYLKRINLYRKRVWTCKATGKINLTYEEALVSEKEAAEKIQNFPKELVAPVLREIQFSMLTLRDLANSVAAKLQGPFSEGAVLNGRKDGRLHRCKIVKVPEEVDKTQYEVAWLGSDNKVTGKALLKGEHLTGKKLPFTRAVLKSFIKDSTYRSFPWVLHDSLANEHGISTAPPKELKSKISIQDGLIVSNRKRKRSDHEKNTGEANENGFVHRKGNEKPEAQAVKYPIDDLLVQPSEEDQYLTERPSPCRDFYVPMECVGNLLMVWDFCTSFGRLLNLSPFSLGDFENAICHKDSTPPLIVESYSALLRLLIKDNGDFYMAIENKKRKPKITAITWTEYLCDFVETSCALKLSTHVSTIKRGHYGLLDINVKLEIFRELVTQVLETDIVREKLDEYIEERHALASTRRDEALEEGKKRREEKGRRKAETDVKEIVVEHTLKSAASKHNGLNGVISEKRNEKVIFRQNHSSGNSENERGIIPEKNAKKQKDVNALIEDTNNSSRKALKLMKFDIKEAIETKNTAQRKEYLEREMEKRIVRTNSLGKDRNRNRYWFFRREAKIFVESTDSMQWGYYETKEELDALIGSLNPKGERERALKKQLEKNYNKIILELQKRSKEAAHRIAMEEEAVLRRSTRVRAPPRENPAFAFLKYVNKWKEL